MRHTAIFAATLAILLALAAPVRAGTILSGYTYVIDGDTIDVGGRRVRIKPMAATTIAVEIGQDGEGEPLWLGLLAFGRVADDLLRHRKGDLLSAFGRLQRRTWKGRDGEDREELQVVVESIVSARTADAGADTGRPSQDNASTDNGPDLGPPAQVAADRGGEIRDEEIPF